MTYQLVCFYDFHISKYLTKMLSVYLRNYIFFLLNTVYTFNMEKEMATHSSTLAWKIPWTKEPSPWGCKESDTTERLHLACKIHLPLPGSIPGAFVHQCFLLSL